MKLLFGSAIAAIGLLVLSMPVLAQTNDDDYTPLGSRIKRARQFPTDLPPNHIPLERMTKVGRERSKAMLNQFSKCLFNRSRQGSLDLLDKTDYGFVNFQQIHLEMDKAVKIYGFRDCLGRVADTNASGVQLRYTAASLRQWLIQAAYFENFPDSPAWVKPGYAIAPRQYPLSERQSGVRAAMDFADCVVATDPYNADFLYRTASGSEEEKQAVSDLTPALGPCLPQGEQIQLSPVILRVWLGEALWHAANHSAPAPVESAKAGG